MSLSYAEAGRRGADVRSDCFVSITRTDEGRLDLEIRSKVATLFGDSIRQTVQDVLAFYGISSARVSVEDAGALPFTLTARLEAAVRRLDPNETRAFPPITGEVAPTEIERDRFRRSRLYLPGNEPKFMPNAGLHAPDAIILDLEDSVAPTEKDAARILVRNALRELDFYTCEKMVRINQLDKGGFDDLDQIVPCNVHTILIPKVESGEQIRQVEAHIAKVQAQRGIHRTIWLLPILESSMGVLRALEIAQASPSVVALSVGLEDFTADLGCERTDEGRESFTARSLVVMAARAAGMPPLDTVYSDVSNEEGLRRSVLESKAMGFEGRGCIHPRQIGPIHATFAPSETEIARALRIVEALGKAKAEGSGVVSLGSKMIDPPVVKRAERTIRMARQLGLVP